VAKTNKDIFTVRDQKFSQREERICNDGGYRAGINYIHCRTLTHQKSNLNLQCPKHLNPSRSAPTRNGWALKMDKLPRWVQWHWTGWHRTSSCCIIIVFARIPKMSRFGPRLVSGMNSSILTMQQDLIPTASSALGWTLGLILSSILFWILMPLGFGDLRLEPETPTKRGYLNICPPVLTFSLGI